MKIHADKIDSAPPHALSIRDVRLILTAVPPEWIAGIEEVHLTNSCKNPCDLPPPWAFFSRYDHSLTISSRGASLSDALSAVFRELAGGALGRNNRGRHRRSKAENHRLQQLVQPYVDELLPALAPPARSLAERLLSHPTSPGFHPVRYLTENA